jgi:hypothetical protein
MLFASGDCVRSSSQLVRLWMHEASRVYGDKMVDKKDIETFNKMLVENIKKVFAVSRYFILFLNTSSPPKNNTFLLKIERQKLISKKIITKITFEPLQIVSFCHKNLIPFAS